MCFALCFAPTSRYPWQGAWYNANNGITNKHCNTAHIIVVVICITIIVIIIVVISYFRIRAFQSVSFVYMAIVVGSVEPTHWRTPFSGYAWFQPE